MAASGENQINLKTLQRVDASIVEIIDHASQVAIYKYERKLEKWEGTDVEGTLFLYRRSTHPSHGFIIVNRMNTTNFVESITSDMQFQLQEPYLLYKNHSGDIIGSWFYEYKDLKRISNKIQTIVLKQMPTPRRQRCASENETLQDDIMTLLSQAHDIYTKNALEGNSQKKLPEPCRGTPESVSPRRRFLSMGSLDPRSSVKADGGKGEEWHREPISHLSPLIPCDENSSPEVVTGESFYHSSAPTTIPLSPNQKKLPDEWTTRDSHLTSMKEVLKSHIQQNPEVVLKIHEAYVSSLRSIFTRN